MGSGGSKRAKEIGESELENVREPVFLFGVSGMEGSGNDVGDAYRLASSDSGFSLERTS